MTDDRDRVNRLKRNARKLGERRPRRPSVLKPWPPGLPRDQRGEHFARVAAEVARLRAEGVKQAAIARRLQISQSTVSRILRGRCGQEASQ